jgi:hypothetical protein
MDWIISMVEGCTNDKILFTTHIQWMYIIKIDLRMRALRLGFSIVSNDKPW